MDLATRARDAGVAVTVETCPHYLFLTEADLERFGPFAKINPALRTEEAVAGLWERLGRGEIDVIGSDHSPFLVEEKAPFADDMWGALPGAPGLESLLPLLLTAVADGRLTWSRLVEVTSANAATDLRSRVEGCAARRGGRGPRHRGPDPVVDHRHRALAHAIARDRRRSGTGGPSRVRRSRPTSAAGSSPATARSSGDRGWGRLVRPD